MRLLQVGDSIVVSPFQAVTVEDVHVMANAVDVRHVWQRPRAVERWKLTETLDRVESGELDVRPRREPPCLCCCVSTDLLDGTGS